MPKELQLFFTALMFFTRLPCPKGIDHSAELLNASQKYFPAVGLLVGGLSAAVLLLMLGLFPPAVAVLLSLTAGILLTGAFHEDGFADTCDAFGGGWTKEQILTIMKDSRLGTYGVTGLLLLLGLKVSLQLQLTALPAVWILPLWLNAHASSRWWAGRFVQTHAYVQDLDVSKAKPIASRKLNRSAQLQALGMTLLPYVLLPDWRLIWLFPFCGLAKGVMAHLAERKIGGYSGDVLGATQQLSELMFWLGAAAWSY